MQDAPLSTGSVPKGVASNGELSVIICADKSIKIISKGKVTHEKVMDKAPTAIAIFNEECSVGFEGGSVVTYKLTSDSIQEVAKYSTNRGDITCLSYNALGTYLAASDSARGIIVYKTESKTVFITEWVAHTAKVNTIKWSPDSLHAVSGSLDTSIEIWNVEDPSKHISIKNAHLDAVNDVEFLDNANIVAVGQDGFIRAWALTY